MSTSSVIGSMQSALNCASRCDCCDKLQQQINAINTKIAGLKNVDENALKLSIKSSLEPGFLSVAAGAAAVAVNKLQPQVDAAKKAATDAFLEIAENTRKQRLLEIEMQGARDIATRAERNAAEYARQMRLAQQDALNAAREQAIKNNRVNRDFELSQAELRTLAAKNEREAERLAQIDRKTSARLSNLEGEIPSLSTRVNNAASDAELAKGLANQSISKTGQVAQDVAKVSSATINTANDVNGLRQFVNGIGSRVNALGEAIGKVESAVATAVTNAAKAIGISEQALGKVIGLAGKVLEIFNLIGTIFTILDGMATRVVLGERIDAVERELQFQGNSISGILGKLLGLQNRIGRNEMTIADVKTIAVDARRTADIADSKSKAAYVLANTSNIEAKQAQLTADGAVRNAAIANENATTAYKQGIKAEGIGQQAAKLGGQALQKAGEALAIATTVIATVQLVKGLQGLRGPKGDKGDRGFQGLPGTPGRDGITTVVQIPGTPGRDGKDGKNGRNGFPGRDGKDGKDMGQAEVFELKAFIAAQHQQTQGVLGSAIAGIKASVNTGFATVVSASSAVVNGANLALLNVINNKLGKQVTGGISGLVTAVAENTYVEKALAVLTFATTLHNALMLTNNLGQTLGSIINTILSLVLPKGLDGTPLDINAVLGKTTEFLIKEAVGEENYTKLTQEWAMANRIYQASANVFNALTNAVSTLVNALEVIGSHVSKIGNALKKWGVLGEKAYEWFHPNPNFHNKYFTFLNNAETAANTIQTVVQVPVSIVDAKNQIDTANAEFKSAIKGDKNPDGTPKESGIATEENKDKKDEFDLGKTISTALDVALDDIFDAGD